MSDENNIYRMFHKKKNKWQKSETASAFLKSAVLGLLLACICALCISNCNAQTITTKKDVETSMARGVFGVEHIKTDFYIPEGTPKGIVLWEHGGGFIQGEKTKGNGGICKILAKDGWLVVNTNYRLANPFEILGQDSIGATKLFWEACYRAIQDGEAAVRYAILMFNLPDTIPVWVGGISAGAVAADESVMWQRNEFASLVDTSKWKNTSNGILKLNLQGSISISGAVFLPTDIDATDMIMIRCYGLKDKTLKCNGGSNHKCIYTGDCQITTMQNDIGNIDYTIVFANATHGLREGIGNIIGASNMKKAITFIKEKINL